MAKKKGGSKKEKKAAAPKKEKKLRGVWNLFEIKDGKLIQKNKWSPKLGPGHFMAVHKDRVTCGGSGYTEFTGSEKK